MAPFNNAQEKKIQKQKYRLVKDIVASTPKIRLMKDIMAEAKHVVVENNDYSDTNCEVCGSGDNESELLLCDKCDKGYHMACLRPIVTRVPEGTWLCPTCLVISMSQKIIEFFKLEMFAGLNNNLTSLQDSKNCGRKRPLVSTKTKRRILPFVPTDDPARRLAQWHSLAEALANRNAEFSNELTYQPGMVSQSANQALLEEPMQVLCKDDVETIEHCRAMYKRGECPPLLVVYDSQIGYAVHADAPIKGMTFLAEYTGDVDTFNNRDEDVGDSLMTLLHTNVFETSLVICPDKRANISRFISGIKDKTPESRKKSNLKCIRCNINGECHALLVTIRNIAKGERLYYDYNGSENQYPTDHFI